jgi:hypothetical protein
MSNRGFTEAVPLSLSSMAHMTMPLEDGVLDGLKQVLQHTLLSCVNYARAMHVPHDWTFRDLTTSKFAWEGMRCEEQPRDLPASLTKLGFKHQYPRNAFIYLKRYLPHELTEEQEREHVTKGWTHTVGILGRVSLLYATQELMTPGELSGKECDEDTPPCVLYKVVVEYRSLPATGNKTAVQAEELSMLSFGGSVDDDVKYGALASLYDDHAKYVLEIYSVRGKKYKFDLMDSTLSDGTVPRLPSKGGGGSAANSSGSGTNGASAAEGNSNSNSSGGSGSGNATDPFVKSLCVTVTDHACTSNQEDQQYAVTRIHLTMEGNLRLSNALDSLPSFHHIASKLQETFLSLNHAPPEMATASPSGHTLLLDPKEAGRVYINGRYVTTWGNDPRIGSHFPALFGMDMHSIPYWHGRIFDYEVFKRQYGQLWQDILTDARLLHMNIGGRLLYRLMTGKDPESQQKWKQQQQQQEEEELRNGYDDDDDDDDDSDNNGNYSDNDNHHSRKHKKAKTTATTESIDTDIDCLESQVIQSSKYDPVGISAKALGTKFKMEFGIEAYGCLPHECEWVNDRLPGRNPIAVPLRVINVLRRGGYFNVKRLSDEIWFAESRKPKEGKESRVVDIAIQLLEDAGCADIAAGHIVVFNGFGVTDPVRLKGLVRYNAAMRQYHVNKELFSMNLTQILQAGGIQQKMTPSSSKGEVEERGFLLGFHIAQEHPDGNVMIRYLLRNRK